VELSMRSDSHDFARLTNLPDGILAARLDAMLPQFATLALSFFIAARLWMLHFKMHRAITPGNDVLLVLNMVLLFAIVLIPFSADVLIISTYPLSQLSVSVYTTNALLMLAMDAAIWRYARVRPHFLAEGTPPDYPARMMRCSLQIAAVFGSSIVVAWFAPRAALYMWAMIPPIIILQARGLSRPSTIRRG